MADLDADLVLKRPTSRLPYDGSTCPKEILRDLEDEAAGHGHKFETRSDADAIGWVVELNKQALFNDLGDDALRTELVKWTKLNGPRLRDISFEYVKGRGPYVTTTYAGRFGAAQAGLPDVDTVPEAGAR